MKRAPRTAHRAPRTKTTPPRGPHLLDSACTRDPLPPPDPRNPESIIDMERCSFDTWRFWRRCRRRFSMPILGGFRSSPCGVGWPLCTSISAADDGMSILERPALHEYAATCNDLGDVAVRKHQDEAPAKTRATPSQTIAGRLSAAYGLRLTVARRSSASTSSPELMRTESTLNTSTA